MASDKVHFAVSMTTLEMVGSSSEGSTQNFIVASEAYGSGGGSGEVTGLDIISGAGAGDGYDDGTRYYQSAAAIAEDNASDAAGSHDLGAMDATTGIEFLYIKHTGFEYSSPTALSATANTTDLLAIQTNSASDERVTIARLYAGEAIVLPVRKGCTLNEFAICASDGVAVDGTVSTQGTIAVEFMAFAVTGP